MLPKHSAHNTHNATLSLLRAKTSAFHPSYYRKWRLQARPGQEPANGFQNICPNSIPLLKKTGLPAIPPSK